MGTPAGPWGGHTAASQGRWAGCSCLWLQVPHLVFTLRANQGHLLGWRFAVAHSLDCLAAWVEKDH